MSRSGAFPDAGAPVIAHPESCCQWCQDAPLPGVLSRAAALRAEVQVPQGRVVGLDDIPGAMAQQVNEAFRPLGQGGLASACAHQRRLAPALMLRALARGGEDILGQLDGNSRHASSRCCQGYALQSRDARQQRVRKTLHLRRSGVAESDHQDKDAGPFAQVAAVGSILAEIEGCPERISGSRPSPRWPTNHCALSVRLLAVRSAPDVPGGIIPTIQTIALPRQASESHLCGQAWGSRLPRAGSLPCGDWQGGRLNAPSKGALRTGRPDVFQIVRDTPDSQLGLPPSSSPRAPLVARCARDGAGRAKHRHRPSQPASRDPPPGARTRAAIPASAGRAAGSSSDHGAPRACRW